MSQDFSSRPQPVRYELDLFQSIAQKKNPQTPNRTWVEGRKFDLKTEKTSLREANRLDMKSDFRPGLSFCSEADQPVDSF